LLKRKASMGEPRDNRAEWMSCECRRVDSLSAALSATRAITFRTRVDPSIWTGKPAAERAHWILMVVASTKRLSPVIDQVRSDKRSTAILATGSNGAPIARRMIWPLFMNVELLLFNDAAASGTREMFRMPLMTQCRDHRTHDCFSAFLARRSHHGRENQVYTALSGRTLGKEFLACPSVKHATERAE
jgi:hypothetical protein